MCCTCMAFRGDQEPPGAVLRPPNILISWASSPSSPWLCLTCCVMVFLSFSFSLDSLTFSTSCGKQIVVSYFFPTWHCLPLNWNLYTIFLEGEYWCNWVSVCLCIYPSYSLSSSFLSFYENLVFLLPPCSFSSVSVSLCFFLSVDLEFASTHHSLTRLCFQMIYDFYSGETWNTISPFCLF